MPKLLLKSVLMRNFGSVRSSSVAFPDSGFVLVTGRNLTGEGQFESIGSGKTLIGEAVSRTLFNVPGRFTKLADYSTNDAGNTYVKVIAELEGKPLTVEMGYKCPELSKTGEGLRFTVGNQTPVMFGNIHETRRELSRIVGMTSDVASWTVYIDGSVLDFDALSEAKSVNLLMGALNQPPWTEYQQKAIKVADGFETACTRHKGVHNSCTVQLSQATVNLAQVKAELKAAQEALRVAQRARNERAAQREQATAKIISDLGLVTGQMAELKSAIAAEVQKNAEKYHELELKVQRAASAHAERQREQLKLERDHGELRKDVEQQRVKKHAAIVTYNKEAYAAANKDRNRRLEEIKDAETRNAKVQRAWDAEYRRLNDERNRASVSRSLVESDHREAVLAVGREENVPCTCPLPGCGKPWPRNNEAALAKAKSALAKAESNLRAAVQRCESAEAAFVNAAPPVLETIQDLPAEQPIAPFPDEQVWNDIIAECEARAATAQSAIRVKEAEVRAAAEAVAEASSELAQVNASSCVATMSAQYEELEKQSAAYAKSLSEYQKQAVLDVVDETPVKVAKARHDERAALVAKLTNDVVVASEELADSVEALKAAKYWVEAYGATGIPNMIINEAIGPLNLVSKRVSHQMTGGLLDVSYSTSRQLKTGEEKNELNIRMTNRCGSSKVGGSSKGESGLLDLIIAETVAEVGNVASRVAYRFYDEVATSQDQTVRRAIFTYLKEIAKKSGLLVFVVDHSVEVASYADYVLVAQKTESEGTVYNWQ